jgi:hypothetical protein
MDPKEIDRLDETRKLVQTAFRAGMVHMYLSIMSQPDAEKQKMMGEMPGVFKQQFEGEEAWLARLVDEFVDHLEPISPTANMREGLLAEWTKPIRMNYRPHRRKRGGRKS